MVNLESTIERIIRDHRLVQPESAVLVAVSAGPDSMALLHILASLQQSLQCSLFAAYVDHGLRPDEIPGEIGCVRRAAQLLAVPCEILSVNTKDFAAGEKRSMEDAARLLRYQALRKCAARHNARAIAVAHTADDQVEEILLRLLRGSGRKGLAGMRLHNDDLIRPLLHTPKGQVLDYLAGRGISYCHDSSNDELHYLRNRVRHILLPLLEKDFDPGIRSALLKTAENFSEDEDYLAGCVEEVWQRLIRPGPDGEEESCVLERDGFVTLHACLQRRLLEGLLWSLKCPARYAHIMNIRQAAINGRNGSELHLSRGLRVVVKRDVLEFTYPRGRKPWRGRLSDDR